MPVDALPAAPPDSTPLHRLLRRTRFLLRLTWVATGLALTVGLLLGALALVVAADLLLPLLQLPFWLAFNIDSGIRLSSLVLVIAPPAVAFVVGVLYPLVRRLSAGQVARRIEARLPGIHNRLVSCIDLESRGRATASPVFYRRLVTESLDRIRGFRPARVLDFVGLRRAGLIAAVGTVAFVAVCCLFSNQMPTAMARIVHPFDDIPPVSFVAYGVKPDGGDFLREEKIDFTAELQRGQINGLNLELRADNGVVKDMPLDPARDDASSLSLTLDTVSIGPAFQQGFHYRVHGGGTWSERRDIRLVDRPLVTSIDTAVFYPAYMGIPEAHPTPHEATAIIGPEGGEVELTLQAEGQVAEGDIQVLKPGVRSLSAKEQTERVWFEDKVPDGAAPGGTWEPDRKAKRPAHTEPFAMGTHGHWFQNDPAGFAVQAGETLFAYVYIDPQTPPDEILLQWNDGKGWEHGAFWGKDAKGVIHEGQLGTPSRRYMGPLPAGGEWVRLEAPASAVGVEGVTLHGMAFKLNGGRCWWGRSGAVRTEAPTFLVDKTLPMHADGPNRWVGRLPLAGKGVFRAELRDAHGHPNKPIKELNYESVKDQPPQIALQRPGKELTLSEPQAPPLTVLADDDYGLADVKLFFRSDENKPFESRILRHFDQPAQKQTVMERLQEAAGMKQGMILHYYLEASDRKGQTARTPEAVVRIAADPNAADKQEEAFDKAQDTFRDRLVQLIAQQKKVQEKVEKTTTEYAQTADKVRKEQEAAAAKEPPADPMKPVSQPQPKPQPTLDPETAKQLAELEKQLNDLAQQENKNAQDAAQLNNDLAKAADQADKLQTLPQPLVEQMQALQQAFEKTAVKGMQNLAQQFNNGANPQAPAPDLKDLQHQGDRLNKDLEGLKDRMEALDAARKGLRDDLAKALEDLQRQMLNENGKLTDRDLQDLRDFLAQMREHLTDLQDQQQHLLDAAEKGGDMKDVQQKQADLDKQLEKMLEAARKMLNNPHRRRPNFPDDPYSPDDETKVPPKDDDTNEPLPNQKKPGDKANPDDKKPDQAKDDDMEPLDMPALGGPKQVPDKRFDKKRRPLDKKPGDPDSQRDDLENHQNDRLHDLDAAQKSLATDQQTLEQMMKALEQAMQANGKPHQPGQPNEADEAMDQLRQMLESPAMRAARAMMNRMRQGQASRSQPQNQPPSPSQTPVSQQGNNPNVGSAELANLPLATREAILKLPPRVREELLQGLREQGPEGYGPFIEDYFKRLTESKNP